MRAVFDMAWNYYPATTADRILHRAGEVPARALEVGDTVTFDAGDTHRVVATTPRLLRFAHTSSVRFRKPIEGDDTDSIYAQPREDL
jgi:hypothetical protein